MKARPLSGVDTARVCTLPDMRIACLTLAVALIAIACGDDGTLTTSTTNPSSTPMTDSAEETGAGTPTSGGEASGDETGVDLNPDNLMEKYGAPCTEDADCVALIAPNAVCVKDILGVYTLPGGYCSTPCAMPMDPDTTFVKHHQDCFFGVDCVGLDGYFESCAPACTDNSQCPRADYECRRLPQISVEGDPTYCLMTEESQMP